MKSYIKAISYYLPEKVLTNAELSAQYPGLNMDDLTRLTGVYERHVSAADETAADMAVHAAEKLFTEHCIDREKIDFIILCTQWGDYITPTTACILQDRLHLSKETGAVDISQGCTGYIYGLSMAKGLIESGSAKHILLLTAETITKSIHPSDKSNRAIFGDGAAATLVSSTSDEMPGVINDFIFGTDGSGYQEIIIKHGGARFPAAKFKAEDVEDNFGNVKNDACFFMNGSAIFSFSVKIVPQIIDGLLKKSNLNFEDIDFFIFHQANQIILETILKKNKIPQDKSIIYLEKVGNTISSTIPIALYQAQKTGKIGPGNKVLLVGFGVGLSWAATLVSY